MAEELKYKLKCSCRVCSTINFTASGLTAAQIQLRYTSTEKAIALTKCTCPRDIKHFGMDLFIYDSKNQQITIADVIKRSQTPPTQENTDTITT